MTDELGLAIGLLIIKAWALVLYAQLGLIRLGVKS